MNAKKLKSLIELLKAYGVSYFSEIEGENRVVIEFREGSEEPVSFEMEPTQSKAGKKEMDKLEYWSA